MYHLTELTSLVTDVAQSTPGLKGSNLASHDELSASAASTPEREHAALTRVRNFEDVRFGEYLVKTW